MQQNVGMGNVGLGSEIPIGLGLLLAGDSVAFERFSSLNDEERNGVLGYVRGGADGLEAENRIAHTVKSLHDGVNGFYKQ